MSESTQTNVGPERKQRLQEIFQQLLPLLDSLVRTIRLTVVLGLFVSIWLIVWCVFLKHFSVTVCLIVGFTALLPTAILSRFWWAVEELKNLPQIAGQMMGDAKDEIESSVQNLRDGKTPKLGILNMGKNLWSVGAMASEVRELVGSYISLTTLVNPVMLIFRHAVVR
ncbi:MAG: hypothetical protein IPN42_16230 [Methylococcaceae bacterium]|nr:hypothetical protein [Methylococcaceae bacterium]